MSNIEVNNQTMECHMESREKDPLWQKLEKNPFIVELKKIGERIDDLMKNIPGFDEAYARKLTSLDCADERVFSGKGPKLGVAGQGILAEENDRKILVDFCRGQVKFVSSHDDCGAANFARVDDSGQAYSKEFAKEIGAEHLHIPFSELHCVFHNGRGIVIDGTAKFNKEALENFPPMFTAHAAGIGLSQDYIKKEVALLPGIDLDNHHGFGDRFNSDSPFYVIISAKDEEQLSKLTVLAKEAVEKFGDRIQVKGFVAPLEQK